MELRAVSIRKVLEDQGERPTKVLGLGVNLQITVGHYVAKNRQVILLEKVPFLQQGADRLITAVATR